MLPLHEDCAQAGTGMGSACPAVQGACYTGKMTMQGLGEPREVLLEPISNVHFSQAG